MDSANSLSQFLRRHRTELSLLIAVIAVVLLTMWLDDKHAYYHKPWYNATEILRQTALLGILALGASVVIISGGIDLSAGSVIAFSGTICASLIYALAPVDARGNPLTNELPIWVLAVAFVGTMASAFLIGSLHAWLVTVIRLPPFVATLASLVGLRSLARVLMQDVTRAVSGKPNTQIYVYDKLFGMLGKDWWVPLVIFVVLAAATWLLLSKTVTGRHLYAMGGNETAARLSGIRTERLKYSLHELRRRRESGVDWDWLRTQRDRGQRRRWMQSRWWHRHDPRHRAGCVVLASRH
ncbi:MAG: ribose transport system permease protein [Planctomycetota bacterium]|nr:MAG: ribose transport system permease protein [Planctomycetota bacterium]